MSVKHDEDLFVVDMNTCSNVTDTNHLANDHDENIQQSESESIEVVKLHAQKILLKQELHRLKCLRKAISTTQSRFDLQDIHRKLVARHKQLRCNAESENIQLKARLKEQKIHAQGLTKSASTTLNSYTSKLLMFESDRCSWF